MSNIITLLERLGERSVQPQATEAEISALLLNADVSEALRAAILNRDVAAAAKLLGADPKVAMLLLPAEDEPAQQPGGDEPTQPAEPEQQDGQQAA